MATSSYAPPHTVDVMSAPAVVDDDGDHYSASVSAAISELLPDDDPFCRADFDVTAYINTLFPTEQSLSQLDDVMDQVQHQIADLDGEIAELVEVQSASGSEGHAALLSAKSAIQELFTRVREIQAKTETSESMVKEITRDIKQLDVAKRNLTGSITTLHHLHILLSGLDSLGGWIERRRYGDIASQLPAVLNVLVLFDPYMSVPQVKLLADQVRDLKNHLSVQIAADFKEAFTGGMAHRSSQDILDICRVVSVLDPTVKADLSTWFVDQQLSEYHVLYADTEDIAWLDRIDQRYRWFVAKLTEFERSGTANLFPADWDMGRRLTHDYCTSTRDMLDRLMTKRAAELDSKLLTHAITHTAMFEGLLGKRFPGKDGQKAPFDGLVWRAFERHMHVFVAAQDKNMGVFLEQCANRIRSGEDRPVRETSAQAYPLPSSGDMFVFFKRTIREATKLSTNPQKILADLAPVFKKCLRGYAHGCLTAFLPKLSGSSVQGTAGLLQSLLKEGEVPRLNKDEQFLTCCILATADWCAETTQQLQDKLREKLTDAAALDMSTETDLFYGISSSALSTLATDLEIGCDAALQTMTKINWSTVENVGDESGYVASIRNHLKLNVPLIRDFLADRRKYFGHLCLKFATTFMSKYGGTLFRCRPISVSGAEQLLLDTHALKTFLLSLPSVESAVSAKPPTAYVKVVTKAMAKAEMILKIVMSDIESSESFVQNYAKLLPESDASEFQKVLEMKAVRRSDQTPLIEMYRNRVERTKSAAVAPPRSDQNLASPLMSLATDGDSRIRKLERLVKKKL